MKSPRIPRPVATASLVALLIFLAGPLAPAAAQTPDIDGYAAALTNFRFLANTVWTTEQAVAAMTGQEMKAEGESD